MLWERDFEDKKNWQRHNNFGDFLAAIFINIIIFYIRPDINTGVGNSKQNNYIS